MDLREHSEAELYLVCMNIESLYLMALSTGGEHQNLIDFKHTLINMGYDFTGEQWDYFTDAIQSDF